MNVSSEVYDGSISLRFAKNLRDSVTYILPEFINNIINPRIR
jgi:hypothetical protein